MQRRTRILLGLLGAFALFFPVHPEYAIPPTVTKDFFEQQVVPRKNEVLSSSHLMIEGRHWATIKVAVLSGFRGRSVFGIPAFLGRYTEHSLGSTSIPAWFPCDRNGDVWITEDNFDAVMKNIQRSEQVMPLNRP